MAKLKIDPLFALAYLFRVCEGDGPDGEVHDAQGLLALMRKDVEYYVDEKSFMEMIWGGVNAEETAYWVRLLVETARYLSDLINGDIPILVDREVVIAGAKYPDQKDDLLIGKAISRAIRREIQGHSATDHEALLESFRSLLEGAGKNIQRVPLNSRYLTTKDVADRLGLNPATVERKFRIGELDGDKTNGNQWRTTESRLRNSRYLKNKSVGNKRREMGEGEDGA